MLRGYLRSSLLLGVALLTSASSILPHQRDEESLKSALDAVTRKQRSLDFSPRDYYTNDLRNFKYHPNDGDIEEKFSRQQNQDLEENDDDLEFLPYENGQQEDIGGGYQNFHNKRLERALLDYFENTSGQKETVPSSFRERERGGGHKRTLMNDRSNLNDDPDKDLAALLYKELQKGPLYGGNKMNDVDNQDYLLPDTLQSYYDKYIAEQAKLDRNNKFYDSNEDPMYWGEIFNKHDSLRNHNSKNILENENNDEDDDGTLANGDFANRERDHDSMYMLPAERRNVNSRYPLGREYGLLLKRYPLTKRSPKPLHHEKEPSGVINDPKIAKDLGSLFGNAKTVESKINRTNDKISSMKKNDHSHEHNHDHNHAQKEHDHDHSSHDSDHFVHDHAKPTDPSRQKGLEATTLESPKSMIASPKATPGQKEITGSNNGGVDNDKSRKLLSKRDNRNVDLTKKSVDWSQYFGIDRRKKKAVLLARPGSQDKDDEWMLQSYYKTMAENLKSLNSDEHADKDNSEKRDKLDQMDARLKNVKNLIVADALKYGNAANSDSQEVKDIVMARLATAYSLEKMRIALDEFRSNLAAQRELMKAAQAQSNETNHLRMESDDGKNLKDNEKRNGRGTNEDEISRYEGRNYEGFDEGRGCPALDTIVSQCHTGGILRGVEELCIMHQICGACDDEEEDCASIFAYGVERICDIIPGDRRRCAHLISYWEKQPFPLAIASCHSGPDSCLRRSYRYRHRGIYYQNGWPLHAALDAER